MTKAEFIKRIASSKKLPEDVSQKLVAAVVDETFEALKETVKKEGQFRYPGFGSFLKRKRKARTGINPRTGEKMKIKAQTTVGFRPAQNLKDFVGGRRKK